MKLSELIYFGPQLFTFNRILIFVVVGLATMLFDSRSMAKRGLKRESLWSLILGILLICIGLGGRIASMIFG